ncbi:hypothetical protein HOLleu_28013 [Holothuria leucospilota]|uniref:Uncharacterized protein n=1 Tax=Holothuria leucospilota TaxID=206669 RepID=A0A9Q1H3N4_HOLLE|nr:hypothetical protein HOLleu_28013 [Holothuria leucospilota]
MMDMSTYSIPIPTKKEAREVGDITNRLRKVLSDVEVLFEEEDDEYSSIAAERRQFQSRYGNISAEVDARDRERNEVREDIQAKLYIKGLFCG